MTELALKSQEWPNSELLTVSSSILEKIQRDSGNGFYIEFGQSGWVDWGQYFITDSKSRVFDLRGDFRSWDSDSPTFEHAFIRVDNKKGKEKRKTFKIYKEGSVWMIGGPSFQCRLDDLGQYPEAANIFDDFLNSQINLRRMKQKFNKEFRSLSSLRGPKDIKQTKMGARPRMVNLSTRFVWMKRKIDTIVNGQLLEGWDYPPDFYQSVNSGNSFIDVEYSIVDPRLLKA